MKQVIFIVFFIMGVALTGFSQQAPPNNQTYNFSLADCVNYAYAHQDSVVNAGLDVKSAAYHVKEVIGQGLPQINGAAAFQDYIKIPTTLIPGAFINEPGTFIPVKFGVQYQSNLSLTGSQILFDPSYLVGLQGRKTYRELYDRSYTRSKIATNVSVTKAYYQVLVGIEELRLLQADIDQLKQQVDETVARNKQGFVELVDVDRINVQYNSLVSKKDNAVRSLILSYEVLKFQMGMPIQYNLTLKDKLDDVNLQPTANDAETDTSVYRNRIEYNLLETQERLNEYDVKLKKGQFLPKLTANANYTS